MLKIGITGGEGFIGWHLRCFLDSKKEEIEEVRVANRETFSNKNDLESFVEGLDLIVHLAGVNRAKDEELVSGNILPAKALSEAIINKGEKPCVIYSSSTYSENTDIPYGKGKHDAGIILEDAGKQAGFRVVNLVIPHVFGEYGKPFYNSGVATFCHQIVQGEKLEVNADGQLELIHVQDLVEIFLDKFTTNFSGSFRVEGEKISVGEVVDKLMALHHEYRELNRLPDIADPFTRRLFNALRGAIAYEDRPVVPQKFSDERGWLVETVKAGSTGQCFVSTTKPGITRGNHYHRRKVERFFVLNGKARVDIRKLFTDEVISYEIDGDTPTYVDIPTLHTHKITNIGTESLITLFWSDEYYDPENSDTYVLDV